MVQWLQNQQALHLGKDPVRDGRPNKPTATSGVVEPGSQTTHQHKAPGLGPYKPAQGRTGRHSKPAKSATRDHKKMEQSQTAHDEIQNELAALASPEYEILSAKKSKDGLEPDLLWRCTQGGKRLLFVAEVKSLPADYGASPDDSQLRKGLGQVLEYRELFRRDQGTEPDFGYDEVHAVLAVEHPPADLDLWQRTCNSVDVHLWWRGQALPGMPGRPQLRAVS